jgi:type I restriction enzyme S subunit
MKAAVITKTEDYITEEGVSGSAASLVPPRTLLMVVRSGILRHAIPVALSGREVAINQDIKAVGFLRNIDPAYVRYFIDGLQTELLARWSKAGTTVESIESEYFANDDIPVPSVREQVAIVEFLDRVTARIDALIAKKRRLLDLLEEKRLAVITHAVTKGLDPNAPMKDSGIDWLGRIPAHWEVKRVKFSAGFITSGSRGWAEYYSDDGAGFLQSGNLGTRMELNLSYLQRVMPPDGAEGRRTAVSIDDVLVCITGARTGAVAHVSEELGEAYINQHVALLRPIKSNVFPRFLAYALWCNLGREQLWLSSYGMKEGLGLQHVLAVLTTSPPVDEQVAIVRYLDDEQARLDRTAAKTQKAIRLLTEYRSALITNAVTGKIDVRGEVAKEAAA